MSGRTISISKSLAPLITLTAIFAVATSVFAVRGTGAPETAQSLWMFEFRLILTWWVYCDRQARGFGVPHEFDAFVFWAWPFVVPYYLYRTRGGMGLLSSVGIYGLYAVPSLARGVIQVVLSQ